MEFAKCNCAVGMEKTTEIKIECGECNYLSKNETFLAGDVSENKSLSLNNNSL